MVRGARGDRGDRGVRISRGSWWGRVSRRVRGDRESKGARISRVWNRVRGARVSKKPFGGGTRGASNSKSGCSWKPGSTYQEHN